MTKEEIIEMAKTIADPKTVGRLKLCLQSFFKRRGGMNDEIPKRTTLPYAITYSGTNNQWYLVVRKPGETKGNRFAFRTCAQMLEYYGFLLLVIADGIKAVINADEEIAAIRESDDSFITREVCGWKIDIERLPF